MLRAAARGTGAVVGAAGLVVLLFTAYQLWGTGVVQARAQARLRAELDAHLPAGIRRAAARAAAAASRHPRSEGYEGPRPTSAEGANDAPGRVAPPVVAPPVVAPPVVAPPAVPPAPGAPIGTIDIPSIGLDEVVVQGVAATDLAMGPGHYPGTPLPGEEGNVAIAGHRTTYRHPFYDLTAVLPGDPIVLTTPQGAFTYRVVGASVVTPTDAAVLAATGSPTLTLTTCNPRYSAATRLVLRAVLVRSVLASAAVEPPSRRPAPSPLPQPGPGAPVALGASTGVPASVSAAAWGCGAVAAPIAGLLLARRRQRWARRAVAAAGICTGLVALFFFFGAIALLVPASY